MEPRVVWTEKWSVLSITIPRTIRVPFPFTNTSSNLTTDHTVSDSTDKRVREGRLRRFGIYRVRGKQKSFSLQNPHCPALALWSPLELRGGDRIPR